MNQLVTLALAEKPSALDAEGYLEIRAKCGSRAKFLKAMSTMAKAEPPDHDHL